MRLAQGGRRGDVTHRHARFSGQWGKVVKVGDVRQTNDRNIDIPGPWLYGRDRRIQVRRILLGQTHIRHKGHNSQHRQGTALFQDAYPFVKEGHLPAELVHHQALHQGLFLRCEEPEGTEELGKKTAALNITHQQDGRLRVASHGHVGEVAWAEVQLNGTPSTLDHHQVVRSAQTVERCGDERPQFVFVAAILPGSDRHTRATHGNHLCPASTFGLEENGVHLGSGGDTRGGGLHCL